MFAISSIPRANSEKKTFEISGMITPTVVVFLLAKPLATAFGRYPNSSITFSTFLRVAGLTFGFRLSTLETVAIDTFASRATSYIVILIFIVLFLYLLNIYICFASHIVYSHIHYLKYPIV